MTQDRRSTMDVCIGSRGRRRMLILVVLAILGEALRTAESVPIQSDLLSGQASFRLCSRKLSDSLQLLCAGRGFNGPMTSYSWGIWPMQQSNGPGLVDECCHKPCSIEYLKEYCNQDEDESLDLDESAYQIVSLPYSSVRRKSGKRKGDGKRKHANARAGWIIGGDATESDDKKRCKCRRWRRKRRRLGKVLPGC